ncbi:hypothetical protein [Bradyrhizobium sp. BRP23]|uniref:hypothetical protein n=1 Tax=Bradyrhizobium sp. BRP23 TaxID=2793820 RepID=UPI001CD264BE|nr:hypothetical protein [Bradyrhizobium sp. BRP23]
MADAARPSIPPEVHWGVWLCQDVQTSFPSGQMVVPSDWKRSCFPTDSIYLARMNLTDIQDFAIQARVAAILGANEFDRVFAGVRFAEVEGPLLYVYAKDEPAAATIEDDFSLLIADIASRVLKQEIEIVLVLPKVLQ